MTAGSSSNKPGSLLLKVATGLKFIRTTSANTRQDQFSDTSPVYYGTSPDADKKAA